MSEPVKQATAKQGVSNDPYLMVGRTLSERYLIEELLGMGGMAVVYRAKHLVTNRTVAVKILKPDLAYSNPEMIEDFLNEARNTANLDHPNIIEVSDADREPDGTTFLVMQYIKGQTLEKILAEEKTLPLERVATLFEQICEGIEHAHSHQIIHRDIKPGNIMIVRDNRGEETVKIVDFGIAKAFSKSANVSRLIGTIYYASPEQLTPGAAIDPRSDIYSLGVLLFQMLTGAVPFGDDSYESIIYQKMNFEPPLLRKLRPEVPSAVEEVLQQAMAKSPERRFQNATEVSRAFWRAISTVTGMLTVDCVDAASHAVLSGASVYLNSKFAGQTDVEGRWGQAGLLPRQYLIEVELPRYQHWRALVQVAAREEAVVTVEMHRESKGELIITCEVADAAIEMDGKKVGQTDKTGRLHLEEVVAGRHTLTISHSEYLPKQEEVEVAIGEVAFLGTKLTPKPAAPLPKWVRPAVAGGGIVLLVALLWLLWPKPDQEGTLTKLPSERPAQTVAPSPAPFPSEAPSSAPAPTTKPSPVPTPTPTPPKKPSPTPTKKLTPPLSPIPTVSPLVAKPLWCPSPAWPSEVRQPGLSATYFVKLFVKANGTVVSSNYVRHTGINPVLSQQNVRQAAVEAGVKCRFPALPKDTWVDYSFTLRN